MDRNGNNGFEFFIGNKRLSFAINGSHTVSSSKNSILSGSTQFVVVTVEDIGTRSLIKLYINGVKEIEKTKNAHLETSTDGLIIGKWQGDGTYEYDGVMDDIQMYNVILSDAQWSEMFNNGEGITGLPTGINEPTDLVMRFQDSFNNTATLGATYNMTGTNITLADGLVGISSGSFGVSALAFKKDVTN